jgi:hypothetical protein
VVGDPICAFGGWLMLPSLTCMLYMAFWPIEGRLSHLLHFLGEAVIVAGGAGRKKTIAGWAMWRGLGLY